MNDIKLSTQPTAQQQIARALAEVFEGKSFRYWKQGKETIFVAKDLVEAAEGSWEGGSNFKRVVGEGRYIVTPLEINGISQKVIACNAKTAVRWLAVARPPRGEELSELVWDIVGRVMDGEQVNAPESMPTTVTAPTTPIGMASLELREAMEPLMVLFDGLGLKKASKCKAYVEHAMVIGPKHGVGMQLIPPEMGKYLQTGEKHHNVAMAPTGGKIVDPTHLGVKMGGYSAAEINNMLRHLKLQERVLLGGNVCYVSLPAAEGLVDTKLRRPRRRGQYTPTYVVTGWRENLVIPHLQRAVAEHPAKQYWA